MTRSARALSAVVVTVLSPAFMIAPGSRAAPAPTIEQQFATYLTAQQLEHIGEGRTINLVCIGHGSPTVILSAGLQNWSLHWRLVQRPLAAQTRVCAWDRAGYGFSSPTLGAVDGRAKGLANFPRGCLADG